MIYGEDEKCDDESMAKCEGSLCTLGQTMVTLELKQ